MLKFLFSTFLVSFSLNAFATTNQPLPKDSTTNIIDKTAALLLLDEATGFYMDGKYREALIKFKSAGTKDPYSSKIAYWTGLCHYKLNNYGYSLSYGRKSLILSSPTDVDANEILSYSYHSLDKLDSALMCYKICLEKMSNQRIKTLRIKERIKECEKAQELQAKDKSKRRNLVELNTGYNEYGALLTNNGKTLYFTARKENTTGGLNNPDDEQFFEDNYRAIWNDKTQTWDSITNDLERLNSKGFDCVSYLSKDGLKGLMTLNTAVIKSSSKTKSSDICEISFSSKGKWQTPKLIASKSINSAFFDGAAVLSADGNTMYFASDRNGNRSMTDIYIAQREGKEWGSAKSISDSINTDMNETTPFITEDGRYLFFSSNGHEGMGGYDVYVSENMGSHWTKPINLGAQVNTVNDDTHFVFYQKEGKVFYSSVVVDGLKSSIDIFEINLKDLKLPVEVK